MVQWLNDLRYARFNSVLARRMLSLIYRENQVYPILLGPTRGMKMRFHSTMTYHTLLGLWELESAEAFIKILDVLRLQFAPSPFVVADVGANYGAYTLLFARLLQADGHVYAFEPSPRVVDSLRGNVTLNVLSNVTVEEKACSDRTGRLMFNLGHHNAAGSINMGVADLGETTEVQSTTLDEYFTTHIGQLPYFIKMDIEGGGVFALKGCAQIADTTRPTLYIESHSPEEDRAIGDFIATHTYVAYRFSDHRWVTQPQETYPHPDGIQGNLFLFPKEQVHLFQPLFR